MRAPLTPLIPALRFRLCSAFFTDLPEDDLPSHLAWVRGTVP